MRMKASVLIRIAVLFICALFMATGITFAFIYHSLMKKVEEQAGEIAQAAATSVMTAIGSQEDLNALFEEETLREKVHETFRFICRREELRYLYLYTVDEEETRHFVISAAESDEDDALIQERLGYGTSLSTPLLEAERNVLSRACNEAWEVVDNEFGRIHMYILPVLNSNDDLIALIGADYSMESFKNMALEDLRTVLLPVILVLTVTYVIALLLIERSVIRPIKALSGQMQSFVTDRKSHVTVPRRKVTYEDEIYDIENSFDKMKTDIGQYVTDIENLTREKVNNQTQLDVARKIQNGIVPEELSLTGDRFEIYGCVRAAREVGGDFYDIFDLDDTHVCAVIGDISGKSISAALFMVMVKTTIRENLKAGHRLAETLNLVNQSICVSNPENMFATVFACVLDTETGTVTFANAGHEAPVVLGAEPYYLKMQSGIALGIFEDSDIVEEELSLRDGEGLLLYTDGIPEAINREKKQYGFDRLKAVVARDDPDDLSTYDARMLAGDLNASVMAYADGVEQFDDITSLVLLYKDSDSAGKKIAPDIRSFETVRKTILSSLGECENTKNIILACEEIFSNIVNYSGADQVIFRCRRSGDEWYVSFSDNGIEFDPVRTQRPEIDFEDLEFGGMGIMLARSLSKDMVYSRMGDRNVLTMVFDT